MKTNTFSFYHYLNATLSISDKLFTIMLFQYAIYGTCSPALQVFLAMLERAILSTFPDVKQLTQETLFFNYIVRWGPIVFSGKRLPLVVCEQFT